PLRRVARRRRPGDAVWSADLFGDTPRLERYVADPTLSLDSRRRALGYVASLRGRKDASVEGLYRGLLRDFPDSWPLTEDLVGYLEWREQYARARAAAEAWLARDVPQAGLEGVSAETAGSWPTWPSPSRSVPCCRPRSPRRAGRRGRRSIAEGRTCASTGRSSRRARSRSSTGPGAW